MVTAKQKMLMKKILLFASAALLFAGCAKENLTPTETPDNNTQKGDITLSFSASQTEFGTKAIIGETTTDEEGNKSTPINWQSTDQISVFDGDNQNCPFSIKNFSAESPSCTFEGTVTKLATDYTAVYPYTEGATINKTGVISGVTLPAIQTAVAYSFDPSAALMAAKTVAGGRELAFKNLVGYVKVTTDFECKQIELCAASKEALAGEGTITFTDGTPSFALGDGAESTITLRPAGDGTLAAGKTYYIAVPAGTLAVGWNISFTATDGKVYSRQGTKPIQFKTNTVINLGTIKLDDLIPYVTFTAESEQTFTFSIPEKFATALGENEYFEYSVGSDEWTQFKTTVNIKFGGSHGNLRLRGKSSKGTATDQNIAYSTIQFTTANSPVDCTGDIRTLIDYENYANANTTNAKFRKLFYQNNELSTAPELPATKLASYCYYEMFSGCTALTSAPKLPAESLASYCYQGMFLDCTALTKAPEELPAETLEEGCYTQMFGGCKALETAPTLLAKTLAVGCYDEMFGGCKALTKAPALPAESLAVGCYNKMFSGCEALETAPALPAKTLADGCYSEMFSGCTALTTAPELPAETLVGYCYTQMFYGCTNLTSVTMLATDDGVSAEMAEMCLEKWLYGAGTNVQVYPALTLYNREVYNKISNYIPDKWNYNIRYKYE